MKKVLKKLLTSSLSDAFTSGSFANQMRQTKAILGDTVATIGEGMLPLITPLIVKFNEFAKNTLPPMVEYITGKLLPGLQGMMEKASGVTVQPFRCNRFSTSRRSSGPTSSPRPP